MGFFSFFRSKTAKPDGRSASESAAPLRALAHASAERLLAHAAQNGLVTDLTKLSPMVAVLFHPPDDALEFGYVVTAAAYALRGDFDPRVATTFRELYRGDLERAQFETHRRMYQLFVANLRVTRPDLVAKAETYRPPSPEELVPMRELIASHATTAEETVNSIVQPMRSGKPAPLQVLYERLAPGFGGPASPETREARYGTIVRELFSRALAEQGASPELRRLVPQAVTVAGEPDQYISRSTGGWVGMMDVDNFDVINAKLGRHAGDQVMAAYKRLTGSITKAQAVLSEDGFRAFHSQALLGKTSSEVVVCFPYASGDEFVIHHPDRARVEGLLEAIRKAADELAVRIVDESGKPTAILRGIPISVGCGPSWKEAWRALLEKKKGERARAMEERIEDLAALSQRPTIPPEIFRDAPQTDPATGLPSTFDVVTETTASGQIPILMWGPVEIRRPGWTKAHQERMYGEILKHMRSLGITDIDRFKETAQEVSALGDQVWKSLVQAAAPRK